MVRKNNDWYALGVKLLNIMLYIEMLATNVRERGYPMKRRFFGLLILALCPVQTRAEPPSAAISCSGAALSKQEGGLREAVEKRYHEISDLAAKFSQESFFPSVEASKFSNGTVSFRRAGKMDWTYEAPDEQRFTSDGSTVWWYQPSTNQVIVRDLTQSLISGVPVSFLLGVGSLRESFDFEAKCTTPRGLVLQLVPKKGNANANRFDLLVDRKDFSPLGAKIIDVAGSETSIVFEDRVVNRGVDEKRFSFQIPKGTDVIDERKRKVERLE